MTSQSDPPNLPAAYTAVTTALSEVPQGRESLFLAKLVLVLCQHVSPATVHQATQIAVQDLEYDPRRTPRANSG
jgi:hypothetical protein